MSDHARRLARLEQQRACPAAAGPPTPPLTDADRAIALARLYDRFLFTDGPSDPDQEGPSAAALGYARERLAEARR